MIDTRTGEIVDSRSVRAAPRVTPARERARQPNPAISAFDLTELRNSGLLFLANRAIHPFGVAIAANVDDDGRVGSLTAIQTRDPLGFTFPDAAEDEARGRLLVWLRRRLTPA